MEKTCESLGITEFDEQIFRDKIEWIAAFKERILTFHFKDGTEKTIPWENECLLNSDRIKHLNNGDEFIMFLSTDERNTLQSLLAKIRNSFAHESFNIFTFNKQRYYYLENNDGYLKARIILKEETLLSWIDIIKNGPT